MKQAIKGQHITLILMFALFFLWQCTNTGRRGDNVYNSYLSLADSIMDSEPNTADSIYRIVLQDSLGAQTNDFTQALIGLSLLYTEKGYYDSSAIMLDKAEKNLSFIDDTIVLMKYHLAKGYLYSFLSDFEETKLHYTEGLNLAKQSNDPENQHTFRLNLGQVYLETGNYTEATKILTEELAFADSTGNGLNQSVALKGLASVAYKTNSFCQAIAYIKQSLPILKSLEISNEYALQLMNLGIYYKAAGMPDSAMMAYQEAFNIMAEADDSVAMVRLRFNMGNILKDQKKYDEAENEMVQIIRFCESQNITEGQIYALATLSIIFKETGRLTQSIEAINSAIILAKNLNMVTILPKLYTSHHEILAEMGKYREAYQSSILSYNISDSLLNVEKQKEILLLNKRYETEKKESENQALKNNMEIQKSNFRFLMLASILGSIILLISIYLLIIRHEKLKQQKLLAEEKTFRSEQESKNREMELKNALIEKQLREQELVFQSLISADLIQINRSVKKQLTPFGLAIPRKKDQCNYIRVLTNLTRDASRDPIAEFEPLFKQLHPAFYEKLLQLAPELSKSELQIAAMVRLNLSTKEIARLTNLSISTIEITRHHIRKKLNLESSVSLTTFLISI